MAIESKMKRPVHGRKPTSQSRGFSLPLFITIGVILLGVAGVFMWQAVSQEEGVGSEILVSGEGYQAVFLSNGQVYFGRLEETHGDFYVLRDVYYMRTGVSGLAQGENVSLIKLGNEVHGPEDLMRINKEHILFVEDMQTSSKVVQAILDHKHAN